ncbi:L7Ae/L30e/S12e/Gadd45 family ribosomal protein [Ammoniphilus oxalaticus]|uniref:L7Ae/L30e/S12e/Gadd45 family ribosomal protein n=1 Tax=Ammoniphilus oxalaticus TaxID=66863 RepID=UPI000E73B3E6|nr:ribosomal L7Ae/L30e/S12e/Gadd45 family protein [Ammoniphilus oxalaticus]
MNKVEQFLGLATKAGGLITGEQIVVKAITSKQVYLVILAADASENTRKKFQDKCRSYSIPLRFYADRYRLGHCIGKEQRVVVGVKNDGFARELMKHMDNEEGGNI